MAGNAQCEALRGGISGCLGSPPAAHLRRAGGLLEESALYTGVPRSRMLIANTRFFC